MLPKKSQMLCDARFVGFVERKASNLLPHITQKYAD